MGMLQDAADLARVYLHSAGAGIPEWAQRQFGDPSVAAASDARVAQSKANTGFAGSVANVAGYFAPGGALSDAYRIARATPAALKAAPKVLGVIPDAERAVRGLINPARANAYARLGLGEVPTTAQAVGRGAANIAANVADFTKAHKFLAAGAGIGIPALALADYGGSGGSAKAQSAQAAAASSSPSAAAAQAHANGQAMTAQDIADLGSLTPAAQAVLHANSPVTLAAAHAARANARANSEANTSPLDALIGAVAKSQGGKVSLDQLSAIGDFTSRVEPDIRRPPTYKDRAANQVSEMSEYKWAQTQAMAKALLQKGDTAGAHQALMQGMDERKRDYEAMLGQDPFSLMAAQAAAAQQVP